MKREPPQFRRPEPPYEDDFRIWLYFIKAHKLVFDRCDELVREASGVTIGESEVLFILSYCGGRLRFLDLASATMLSQSRISRQIDALKAKGLVTREITDSNRRATYAVLTPKGQRVQEIARDTFIQALGEFFFNRIDPAKLAVFTEVLESLLDDPGFFDRRAAILEASKTA